MMQKAKNIKLLICDVDGVLTDGGLYFDQRGDEFKRFNVQDGYGLKLAMSFGIEVGVISARKSPVVEYRLKDLGIKHYYQGQHDKKVGLLDLLKKLDVNLMQTAYIGDDIIDLPIMTQVGLSIAVSNSVDSIKIYADYITKMEGGNGAVREVCDLLLSVQGFDQQLLQRYLP